MRRLLHDEASHRRLADTGWAPLPPLPLPLVESLRHLAVEMQASLVRHARSSDVGFDELWGNADEALRNDVQARMGVALESFLRATFEDFRPVLYNLFVKRARTPESSVRYHHDFAMIDERGGDSALQLWIPLVDTTPDNGALIVVEGSHRDASWARPHDTRHRLHGESLHDLPPGAVSLPLRAGCGIAFTNRTVHGSPANRSAEDRHALGCVLVPADAPLAHLVRRPDGSVEIWAFSDDDLKAFRPGWFPPSARRLEVIPAEQVP